MIAVFAYEVDDQDVREILKQDMPAVDLIDEVNDFARFQGDLTEAVHLPDRARDALHETLSGLDKKWQPGLPDRVARVLESA